MAGRFYNFELTQNREKTRNGSTGIYFLKLNNVSFCVLAKCLLITRMLAPRPGKGNLMSIVNARRGKCKYKE
jgi:hypothetical protein